MPGRDLQAHAAEHRPASVAEPDVVERDGAGGARRPGAGLDCRGAPGCSGGAVAFVRRLGRGESEGVAQRQRVRLLRHLERRVQHFVDPLAARDRPLRQPGQPADDLSGIHQHHQVAVEGDERAQGEVALDHLPPAVVEEERDGEVGDERDERDVDGSRPGGGHARLEHPVAAVAELLELVVLPGEDAHDTAADHVLLGGRRHVRDLLLHVLQDRLEPQAEADGDQQEEGQERQGKEGEPPVHQQQDDGDRDHHDDVGDEEDEAVAQEHAHVLDVAHGPAHELAGGPAVEVAEGLAQEMRPHAVPQVVLDAQAGLAAREAAADADDEADGGQAQEGEPVGDQQPGLAPDQGVVDGELDDARHDQPQSPSGRRPA